MNKKINEQSEFNHFQDLSNQWWIPDGQFKILHAITPLRVKYIKKNMNIDFKKRGKLLENVEVEFSSIALLSCEYLLFLIFIGPSFVNN